MPTTRRNDPDERAAARTRRREELGADIAARLRGVCGHLSDEAFFALVRDIAEVTLKYEERELLSPFDSGDPTRREV